MMSLWIPPLVTVLCSVTLVASSSSWKSSSCQCSDPEWCQRIKSKPDKEVFIFSVTNKNWRLYDWNKVTTVVEFGDHDPQLVCFAHSKGARVVSQANIAKAQLINSTARQVWVKQKVLQVKRDFVDGINIDFEDYILPSETDFREGLNSLVQETSIAFKKNIPHAQLTFDVAYSPDCIDARCYDYQAIAKACDFVFVMSYDERSQIRGPCVAWANSPFNVTVHGLRGFLQELHIPPEKLVLGVPWYGYKYPCVLLSESGICYIKKVPFRNVSCSDAAGQQVNYADIIEKLLLPFQAKRRWDDVAKSPYFVYKDPIDAQTYQVWYDDGESLGLKYDLVGQLGLRGIGVWNADSLDYTDTPIGEQIRRRMWGLLPDKQIFRHRR